MQIFMPAKPTRSLSPSSLRDTQRHPRGGGVSLRPRERGAINKNRLDSPPNVNDEWLTFDVESLAADLSEKEREKERIDPIETRFYSDYRAAAG